MTIGSLNAQDLTQQLMEQFLKHKETSLVDRRFKHRDLMPLIEKLPAKGFRVEEAGKSHQGRTISLISIGQGSQTALLWSQMHGNEATATMALFDIFNFLGNKQSEFAQQLLERVTLYFIPMLNPDGAELFQRRTSQGIDMNRDALKLQCPESQILKSVRDRNEPDFGFNLHDQNIYYNVGRTEKSATISFLAPAYNEKKEVNTKRDDAMKVITVMDDALQDIIPGHVGKYDDTFEPRAFGDNIQKWGSRTILIESGGYTNDPEKQFIRQLNFVAILTGLNSIGSMDYQTRDVQKYWNIPFNSSNLNDVLIRNVKIKDDHGNHYFSDIAIRREEFDQQGNHPIYFKGTIEDLGDLSTQYGYQEIELEDLVYAPGKIYPETLPDRQAVVDLGVSVLLDQGYTYVKFEQQQGSYKLPLDIIGNDFNLPAQPKINQHATFLLLQDDTLKYVVINGFVYEIRSSEYKQLQGWVY